MRTSAMFARSGGSALGAAFFCAAGLLGCGTTPPPAATDSAADTAPDSGASLDADNDGTPRTDDCDDTDPRVHPGAPETCDGIDEDCDGAVDDDVSDAPPAYADGDHDGFGDDTTAVPACTPPSGYVLEAGDCDDTDASAFPGGPERCDGADNDCDGRVDTDAIDEAPAFLDADADGHGDPALRVFACEPPAGYAAEGDDCDDADASSYPGAPETDCADPVDHNCDGSVAYADADADGAPACTDCDDTDAGRSPLLVEQCDDADVDEDCSGAADDDDAGVAADGFAAFAPDDDADGYGAADSALVSRCDAPAGYAPALDDCDDHAAGVHPGAVEVCDPAGTDEDCDTLADDADPGLDPTSRSAFARDGDGDGFGNAARTVDRCVAPAGWVTDTTDCDDTTAARNPGAVEVCDDADVDEDCDGTADDTDPSVLAAGMTSWYVDADGDDYGDPAAVTVRCNRPAGAVRNADDCDDTHAEANPDGLEVCDPADVDEDCDGAADDADADVLAASFSAWYTDADGDGFGDAAAPVSACDADATRVADSTDCDDTLATVSPVAAETCATAADDDCDGTANEVGVAACATFYADADGDGYGVTGSSVCQCEATAAYPVAGGGTADCDDTSASTSPGASELCDNLVDDDCDGLVDEDCIFPYDGEYTLEGAASDADVALTGMRSNDDFGEQVSAGGDFDGDGLLSAVVVATEAYYRYSWNPCVVYVYDGFPAATGNAESVDVAAIYGCSTAIEQVWAIPDFDGDGRDELAVLSLSAYQRDVHFFEGGDLTTGIDLTGSVEYDRLIGISGPATGAGDYEGTGGNAAVAVGYGGGSNHGVVYVYRYASAGLTKTHTLSGTTNADNFGYGVAGGAGNDPNGDGADDLFVGAIGVDTTGSAAGAVYVMEAPSAGAAASATVKINGAAAGDFLGYHVAAPGDVDGDGRADLLATAPYNDDGGTDAGAVYLFADVDPDLTGQDDDVADFEVKLLGDTAGDSLGLNRVATGDVNADGEVDFLVGSDAWDPGTAAGDAGAAWFFYGPLSGTYDLSTDYDARFVGDETGDQCGSAVAMADLDADGGADLLVGCRTGDAGTSTDQGVVYFFEGGR